MIILKARFLVPFFVITLLSNSAHATNQEPVNIGFIFSLPWDISNTLRAPVAGPLSIVLASGLALICFAGLVFAPVWWVFGIPKRKYYLHSIPTDDDDDDDNSDNDNNELPNGRSFEKNISYPDFTESLFLFVPPLEEGCKLLLTCHGHGFLSFLPSTWVKIYHFFSKKMLNLSTPYKNAVILGLEDQGKCMGHYKKDCSKDIVNIAKASLYYNIPSWLKEFFQLEILP